MKSSLSILSFNIGLSLTSIHDLLSFAIQQKADFICLQEVPLAIASKIPDSSGYTIISSSTIDRGVAIIFHSKWKRMILDVWEHPSNRAISISFRTTEGILLVSSVYLPTNLHSYPSTSPTFQSTLSMVHDVITRAQSCTDSIICGDFNEDDTHHRTTSSKCRIGELLRQASFIDAHRTFNQQGSPISLSTYFYNNKCGPSSSRLDYIWVTPSLFSNLEHADVHTDSSHWGTDDALHHTRTRKRKQQNSNTSKSLRRNYHGVMSLHLELDYYLLPPRHQQTWPRNTPLHPRTSDPHPTVRFFFAHACHVHLSTILPQLSSLLSEPDFNLHHLERAINAINSIISHNAQQFYGIKRHHDLPITPNIRKLHTLMMHLNSLRRKIMIILNMIPPHIIQREYSTSHLGPPSSFTDPRLLSQCSSLSRAGIATPSSSDPSQWKCWLETTLPSISSQLQYELRLELQSLGTTTDDKFLTNRKIFYQKCLKGSQSCSISSLTDPLSPTTTLSNQQSISSTLTTHFYNLFNKSSPSPPLLSQPDDPIPYWLEPRKDINKEWYSDLMSAADAKEIKDIIKNMNQHSSPGHDGIAIRMIQEITNFESSKPLYPNRVTIPSDPPTTTQIDENTSVIFTLLVNACLRLGDLPSPLKLSTLCPIPKQGKSITNISNIRPISIQPTLARIIMALLAKRLTYALSKHHILDKAQEAFLQGGNIHNCIRSITSIWQHRIQHKRSCYSLFYDIAKAYDTTSWRSIELSLKRLCLPQEFINFTLASLANSSFRIRLHPHHLSDPCPITQSVKQGDPLSPLLFIIVMDPLHHGYRRFAGYRINDNLSLQSVGYADDTCINAESFEDLAEMNEWTLEFFCYHGFKLQPKKCLLLGISADGIPLSTSLTIDGQEVLPTSPFKPIRYLGALLSMDLSWTPMIKELHGTIHRILHLIRQYPLTPVQSKYMIHECLHPKLEIGFRHATIPKDKLIEWDSLLARTLFLKTSCFGACHISYISTVLRIKNFQALYDACYISDFYISLNDSSFCGLYLRSTLSSMPYPLDHSLHHATSLMQQYNLQLTSNPSQQTMSIDPCPPTSTFPLSSSLWSHASPSIMVKAYTDGSTTSCLHEHLSDYSSQFSCPQCNPRSGSGVVITDSTNSSISHRDGFHFQLPVVDNYFAELAPIVQCHFSTPLSSNINIISDSLSNIKSIEKFRNSKPFHYQMYRLHCWPLLNLLTIIDKIRASHGGSLSIDHILAHQDRTTAHSPSAQRDIDGNAIADEHAKLGASTSAPLWSIPIEWGMGPYVLYGPINGHPVYPIYTDIRAYILERHRWNLISLWNNASRGCRSEILTSFSIHQRGPILSLINKINKTKDSKLLSLLASSLTQSFPTRRSLWHQKKCKDDICQRCSNNTREDSIHIFLCTANNQLKHQFLREIRTSITSTNIEQIIKFLTTIIFTHPTVAPFHIFPLLLGNLPKDIQQHLQKTEQQKLVYFLHSLAKNIYDEWIDHQ